jgi:uncharacterized protein (TIGR03435 family)
MAWVATRIDMGGVTSVLALLMRRPVIDKTDVAGLFDVSVELPPLQPEAGVSVPSAIDTIDSGPSVFTVLREQLGLTLESGRGPAEYLVVDSVGRPSEN